LVQIPEYPEPIVVEREPDVTVRYEYDNVQIVVPKRVLEGQPTAFRLGIYHRGKQAAPLLEQLFFPEDSIMITLPRNILNPDSLGNRAVLSPLGGDYEPVSILFTVPLTGDVHLDPVPIHHPPLVLTGKVLLRKDKTPVAGATVTVTDTLRELGQTRTDSLGFFRFEFLSSHVLGTTLTLTVDTEGRYAEANRRVSFATEREVDLIILLGPSEELVSQGMIYRVRADLVPFRSGPENGAPIHFFLARGEIFVATKVAGDRLYGFVELVDEEKGIHKRMDGWVLRQYLEYQP
jgi:hypothetical protein